MHDHDYCFIFCILCCESARALSCPILYFWSPSLIVNYYKGFSSLPKAELKTITGSLGGQGVPQGSCILPYSFIDLKCKVFLGIGKLVNILPPYSIGSY